MSVVEHKSFHKSGKDKLKLYAAVLSIIVGIVAFNLSILPNIFVQSIALLVCAILATFLAFNSAYGRQFMVFFKEAKIELRRVVWPTITETKQMTYAVLAVIAISVLFLLLVDGILRQLLQFFISLR